MRPLPAVHGQLYLVRAEQAEAAAAAGADKVSGSADRARKAAVAIGLDLDVSLNRVSAKFKEKYNIEPSLYASKGYELARVIIELLKMGGETELKKNLLIKKEK